MQKNKKGLAALVALLAIAVTAGSFAYFTQEANKTNEFETGKYKTEITEEFTPPTTWTPGTKTDKDVTITNLGNVPVVVRATLDESWVRMEDILDLNGDVVSKKGEAIPVSFIDGDKNTVDTTLIQRDNVVDYTEGMDLSEQTGKWVWVKNETVTNDIRNSGYFYYIGVINEEEKSSSLIQSVTMNPLLKPAILETKTVVTSDGNGGTKTTTEVTTGTGYDSAKYTLNIKATTVQATEAAIIDTFNVTEGSVDAIVVSYLAETYGNSI